MSELEFRSIAPGDYAEARAVADRWLGREVGLVMHRLFFDQLGPHGVWATRDERLVGFLLGLISVREPDLAYVHFHAVDPARRRAGIGATLYRAFGDRAQRAGCTRIRALAPLWNEASIAFHRRLGFAETYESDYVGPGEDRLVFERGLPLGD